MMLTTLNDTVMKNKPKYGRTPMRNIALEMVRVTESAARAAARWTGRGDKHAADAAAVEAMRTEFSFMDIAGVVVIGEGERDEAPMLYIGEKVGNGNGPQLDIALDPLEVTNGTADGGINALSVVAAGPRDTLLNAPDTYMDKIAVGPAARAVINILESPTWNLQRTAEALQKPVTDVVVCVLKRERNQRLIDEIRRVGARIHLIEDGDVAGAIAPSLPDNPIDMLMGIGAAPEGVLAAAAIRCMGGGMQAKMVWKDEKEITRARGMGITDPERIYTAEDLARGDDIIFAATGVTDGDLLHGVRTTAHGDITHSLSGRVASGTVRFMETLHQFGKLNR